MRWLPLLFFAGCGMSCGDDAGPMGSEACCNTGAGHVLRATGCMPGEIAEAMSRCGAPVGDAGVNACGNAKADPGEACDLSAATAPACGNGLTCVNCACVSAAVCGDGRKEGSESCEVTADCQGDLSYCQGCQCVFKTNAVTFRDSSETDRVGPMGRDLSRVEMALKGPPEDLFRVVSGAALGDEAIETCLVFMDGASEVRRVCVREQARMGATVVVREAAGGERMLVRSTDFRVSSITTQDRKPGSELILKASAGLTYVRTQSFHWESLVGGAVVDRLPDTGEISFTEILGR